MTKQKILYTTAIAVALFLSCQPATEETNNHPNIIYILADDLGYGDISIFNGGSKIQTPNIDAIGKNGMIFTDAHSGSSVCTPTRYGILTGRYSWRSTLQNGVTWSWDDNIIPSDRSTVASLLKKHNYHTACVGKWHLGLGWEKDSSGIADITKPIKNAPSSNGFDYFFGIAASLDIPPYIYIENEQSTTPNIDTIAERRGKEFWRKGQIGDDFKHEEVLPTLQQKAISYIEEQAKSSNPFFLYFPLPAPHTPILPTAPFKGKSGTNEYGDFVIMIDDLVGQVVKTLKEQNLYDNTLIIFTSDNGCSPMANFEELEALGHDPSYHFRGHKADIFEGGHRVPFLVQWPERINAGAKSKETICHTDLMSTCAAIVGDSLNMNEGEDSYNLLPVLEGQILTSPLREATVHHSVNGSFSIRQNEWKLIFCPGSGGWSYPVLKKAKELGLPGIQLYNLSEDPSETENLADQHPEIVDDMTTLMERYIEEGRSTPGNPQQNDTNISWRGL